MAEGALVTFAAKASAHRTDDRSLSVGSCRGSGWSGSPIRGIKSLDGSPASPALRARRAAE